MLTLIMVMQQDAQLDIDELIEVVTNNLRINATPIPEYAVVTKQ